MLVLADVGDARADDATDTGPGTPIYGHINDIGRSIYAVAAADPVNACDCMTPILIERLTPEAHAKIDANPDRLPFGTTLFRDATPEEAAQQKARMEQAEVISPQRHRGHRGPARFSSCSVPLW
ncbi:MAG: hypothetical protein SGJ07_16650 [Rhodospirillaceae bacterium]|nr:hypothetical protein [Rhodospirillaceae bacterium]